MTQRVIVEGSTVELNGTTFEYFITAVTGIPAGFYSFSISSLNADCWLVQQTITRWLIASLGVSRSNCSIYSLKYFYLNT